MTRLRVISWNLHGAAKPRLDAVAELLRAHQPDVVVLQEVHRNQARRIAGLLEWPRPAWALKHNAYWPAWWRAEGLGVLSHHPLAVLPAVDITPEYKRRTYRRRILLPVEVVLDGDRRVLTIDGHLSSDDQDEDLRTREAHQLVGILPPTLPTLVAADLNTDPDGAAITTLLDAGFVDSWAAAGTGHGYTIPANAPRRRIDYIMVRGPIRVREAKVIDDLGAAMAGLSDHRPVLAELEVEAPELAAR